jgi:Transport and Golgi organisation 2
MCTAILSIEPGAPVLLAGVRDELVDRAWQPPGRHWPDYPGLIGGRDLLAGGTWLALAPEASRVACVLNGQGQMAPVGSRRSRGVLPLQAAVEGKLGRAGLADFDPFHLLSAEPGTATLWTWDGERLTDRELAAGLHIVVNSGIDAGRATAGQPGSAAPGRDHELARIDHFLPLLRSAPRPTPLPGGPVAQAWGSWLPLMNGDGLDPSDPRALIVRRDLGQGRIWGTTSISLVALAPGGSRYDFNARPGDPDGWYPVPLGA